MSTLVEQLQQGLARLEQDPKERAGLAALAISTVNGVARQIEIFRSQWPQDPEINSEEASSFEGSLLSLVETVRQLSLELQGSGPIQAAPWCRRLDQDLEPVRRLRARPAPTAPTSNAWINRALIHLHFSLKQGVTSQPSRTFLQTLPEEEERLAGLLAAVPEETEARLRTPVETLLGILDQWIECGDRTLPPEASAWPEQILHWQQRYDQSLADYIQAVASQAPTSFPVLNLILATCQGDDPALQAGARALCAPAANLLRSQIDPYVLEHPACQELFALLAQGPHPEFPARLERLAHEVAQQLALFTAEEPLLSLSSESTQELKLPPLLASLLTIARRQVHNGGAENELRQGVLRLQTLLKNSQNSQEPALKLARQDLGKVVLLLEELIQQPGADALEELGFQLQDCAESLDVLEKEQTRS